MDPKLSISLLSGAGFVLGVLGSYLERRQAARWLFNVLHWAAFVAVGAITFYLSGSIRAEGTVQTFQRDHSATLLLAALVGLTGLGTHVTASLRGLEGFLFSMAALVSFGAIAVIGQSSPNVPFKAWFISHALAFAMSGACFVIAGAAGAAYLIAHRLLRRKRGRGLIGIVPPLEALERLVRWALLIGFPLFTYGVLTGICELVRTNDPGPRAWLQDPLIILSFIAWVAYALMVLAVLFLPWIRGRRTATMATWGMGLIVVIFLVVEVVSPLHR